MKIKRIALFCGFLAVAVLLLWLLQALLMPKYAAGSEAQEGSLIGEYYADIEAGHRHQVIFVGDCEVYENFSPVTLWEEYGVTSFIRGSAQQLIWQSYYLLEETFSYETPDVVVFNVLSMKYDTPESTDASSAVKHREAYNRMTLDGMKWSTHKWNAVKASLTEEEKEAGGMALYLFPILRYHSRWSQLEKEDFTNLFHKETVSDNGYLMQTRVSPVTAEYPKKPLTDYTFSESCFDYLDRMRTLCEEHGTQFVLIKAPSLTPVWYDEWDEQIAAYAETYGLTYYNFLTQIDEIGIDWSTDTYDAGAHLNVFGAEKMTSYFGKLLTENGMIHSEKDNADTVNVWEEKVSVYQTRKQKLLAE